MPFSILDTNNSPNFNVAEWGDSRRALVRENGRKGNGACKVAYSARRLRSIRFDSQIQAVKVVNVETPTVAVVKVPVVQMLSNVNMGMTVAAMRKIAKKRGHKGYSKLLKADLCAMLA